MTARWNTRFNEDRDHAEVDAFLKDLEALMRKHNLALSHEDAQGAFIVECLNEVEDFYFDWLNGAQVDLDGGTPVKRQKPTPSAEKYRQILRKK